MEIMKENTKGYISNGKVKAILFSVISLSIFISVMVIILAIWDYIGHEVASKVVGTLGAIIGGGMLFSWVNTMFAPAGK